MNRKVRMVFARLAAWKIMNEVKNISKLEFKHNISSKSYNLKEQLLIPALLDWSIENHLITIKDEIGEIDDKLLKTSEIMEDSQYSLNISAEVDYCNNYIKIEVRQQGWGRPVIRTVKIAEHSDMWVMLSELEAQRSRESDLRLPPGLRKSSA